MLVLAGTVLAQENPAPIANPQETVPSTPLESIASAPLVTATATAKRVRFVSPGSVVQLRLEVYNEAGQKVFDTELRGGNVLDWHLLDGSGERVAAGSYASVLTTKSLSGRLSQRMGVVRVSEKKVALEGDGTSQLSLAQQQTIGPMEANGAIKILHPSDAEAITAVTHDGADGQLTSTAGSLTFRTGDVFAGRDKEHMRITEAGRVGVGTDKPQATLDVAGTVRVSEGIRFPDGTTLDASSGKLKVRDAAGEITEDPAAQGTGNINHLAKWSETGGAGNLTNAAAAEVSGLTIFGQNASSQVAPLFPTAFNHHVLEVGAPVGKSPLVLAGGSGLMEFWKDLGGGTGAPAAAVAFGMARPGLLATNDMVFSTYTPSTSWQERMRITTGGKIGIGTPSPLYPLTVSGRGTLLPFSVAEFSNDHTDSGIILNSKAGTERAWALLSSGTGSGLGVGTFSIADLNANQTRFSINSSGNVGIGTPPTTSKLVVSGATEATQFNIGANRVLGNLGTQNIFGGVEAGLNNTGSFNSFFGFGAGRVNTGNANAFFGTSAGLSNMAGHSNSLFGVDAGRMNTSGVGNSFFGIDAGRNNAGGHSNTFVGREAGKANTSGIHNTIIGAFANLAHPDLSNATAIGYNALVSASNTMVLGTSQVTVQVPGTLAVSENLSAANISADNISAPNMPGVEFEQFKCFGCGGREVGSGDGTPFDVTLRSVNVPAAGFLFITAHAEFDFTSGDLVAGANLNASLELVGPGPTLTAVSGSSNEGKRLTLNLSWVEPVGAAGTVQLKTVSRSNSFDNSAFLYKVRSHGLHVIYVPRRLN